MGSLGAGIAASEPRGGVAVRNPDCPVIIVGAGPVGLLTAACLARLGVRALVIDQNPGVAEGSRAVCLSRRTLEILDAIGAAEPFVRKGLGWTHGSAYAGANFIHRLAMPHGPDDKHWPMTNLQQYYMEEFLLAHCAGLGVEIRRNTMLVDVAQDDGVLLRVSTPSGMQSLRCDYLIAADGARSQVRRSLGLALEGVSYTGRYLIADIRMESAAPTERRVWFDPPSNRGSTIIMHKQPDAVWRIDYQLQNADDEEQELRSERVRERIQSHLDFIGERAPWELLWSSIYRAHSLALQRYRYGRILFAGDAAHLVPIFGVRGLNSGVADAHNLAWKLAMVLRGEAAEPLLDTYSDERRAATLGIFRQSAKSTRFMTPHTPGDAIMRDAVLALAVKHEFVRSLVDPRQSVPYEYRESQVNSFPEREREFSAGIPSGAPLKNMRVRKGGTDSFLLDWLGDEFTALFFAEGGLSPTDEAGLQEITHGAPRLRVLVIASAVPSAESTSDPTRMIHLEDPHEGARRFYGASHGTLYLVRPDGHVCARWRQFRPDELILALRSALDCEDRAQAASSAVEQESALETTYRELVEALDAHSPPRRAGYLARVVLLLLREANNAQPSLRAVEEARMPDLADGGVTAPEDPRNERTNHSAS